MKLINLLPENYRDSKEAVELQNALNSEMEKALLSKEDLFNQFDVETATWGLRYWEEAYGIEVDVSKSDKFRRERIRAKIRGTGSVTKQMIIDTAASYSNGEVEVIEDYENYSFTIKFVGTRGIPGNLADLIITIKEIKPSHLNFDFEFTYLNWDEFDGYNKTWDQWDYLNLTWDEFEKYREVI